MDHPTPRLVFDGGVAAGAPARDHIRGRPGRIVWHPGAADPAQALRSPPAWGGRDPCARTGERSALSLVNLALVVVALALRRGTLAARPRRDGADPSTAADARSGPRSGA
jgi:hypothetical protein